jgi:F-box/leucine-rich repeat protein 10/11
VASLLNTGNRGFVGGDGHQLSSTVQSPPAEAPEHPKNIVQMNHVSYASPTAVKVDVDTDTITSMSVQPTEPSTSLVSPPTSLAGEMDVSPGHGNEELQESVEGDHDALHTPTSSSRQSSRQPRQVERYVPGVPPAKTTIKEASPRHASTGGTKSAIFPVIGHQKTYVATYLVS